MILYDYANQVGRKFRFRGTRGTSSLLILLVFQEFPVETHFGYPKIPRIFHISHRFPRRSVPPETILRYVEIHELTKQGKCFLVKAKPKKKKNIVVESTIVNISECSPAPVTSTILRYDCEKKKQRVHQSPKGALPGPSTVA